MLRSLVLFVLVAASAAFSPLPKANARSSTALNMADEVKVGDKLPAVTLQEGQADYGRPEAVDLAELIAGKKVAIFAVPGAFTPGCSKSHLPSFITAQDELKAKGVELTICIATNDAFVMEVSQEVFHCYHYCFFLSGKKSNHEFVAQIFSIQAWGRTSGGADAGILFLSDANAELSKALGLLIESPVMVRTKRFSLIADDGVVTHYFSADKEASDTWAPNVLAAL